MPASGSSFDILGVTIGRVSPVHELLHLHLNENLIALYGLNGAGKTRLLTLIEMALAGVVPDEDLEDDDPDRRDTCILDVHIQLRNSADTDTATWVLPSPLQRTFEAACRRLADSLGPLVATDTAASGVPRVVELLGLDLRRRLVDSIEASGTGDRIGEHLRRVEERVTIWSAALQEAIDAGRLTLRAYGTVARPSWSVYIPISASDATGATVLAACTEWFQDRTGPAIDPRRPFSADADCYWLPPRWLPTEAPSDTPVSVQVPMAFIGRVDAATIHEIHVDLGDGRPRRWLGGRDGLRLADVIGLSDENRDSDAATLDDLVGLTGRFDSGFLDSSGRIDPGIAEEVLARSKLANEIFSRTFPGAPKLEFRLGEAEDWVRGVPPAWFAGQMHISALSSAQERWARVAIALANVRQGDARGDMGHLRQPPTNPLVLLSDEPERGLHRLREHHLAQGLGDVLRLLDAVGVVATHSPDLLASPLVRPALVSRDSSRGTSLRDVPLSVVDGVSSALSADTLGLSVGDLWALSRLTVVVEGIHDEWVFGNLLRDSLDNAVASIFPIHGATRLRSLAEARLLVHGTDAPVLVVLDEMSAPIATELLENVKSAVAAGDPSAVHLALERLRNTKGDSYLFLHQFAHAALDLGALNRVWVYGLSLPDVICYLPIDLITGTQASWAELVDQWRSDAAPAEPKNIKAWLRRRKLIPNDPEAVNELIRTAADRARRTSRPVHEDLVGLGARIVELSHANPIL